MSRQADPGLVAARRPACHHEGPSNYNDAWVGGVSCIVILTSILNHFVIFCFLLILTLEPAKFHSVHTEDKKADTDEWQCEFCTFINDARNPFQCEV